MRGNCLIIALAFFSQSVLAQTSRDTWDSKFNPKAVKERQERAYQQWVNSWKDRECTAADVKARWLMTLKKPEPDSMDSQYYTVRRQNQELEGALLGTDYDFEAQDIADQINIIRYREKGQTKAATDLELVRQERIPTHQQQIEFARQRAMQEQMLNEISQLRQEVAAARAAAEAAESAAWQSHH